MELIAKRQSLEALFSGNLGFDGIRKLNVQDGIRCFFHNGDIAHVRPSGNAPQLRIYAHARTLARAEAIVDYAMQEPDGILRQLQRWIDERGSDG
jgi:phosphomannomutase